VLLLIVTKLPTFGGDHVYSALSEENVCFGVTHCSRLYTSRGNSRVISDSQQAGLSQ